MADPISVQCPHCKVKLKLKAAPPAGKKIGCPKCKKPFPMKAPPKKKESDDDFLDALDDLSEDDYEAPEDEESQDDEEEAAPARSTMRSKSGVSTKKGGKGKKGRSKKSSAGPILAIIGGSVAVLLLVGGLVYLLMNLPGGGKGGIRSASGEFIGFVPADAEVYVAARPADIIALPMLASVIQNPQAKQRFDEMEKSFGFPITEVDHVFGAIKVDPNAVRAAQAGGPMGGNPMMGMPPGMPGIPGMGGGNQAGLQDAVYVVRLKQAYGGKGLDQIRQLFPPKTYKDVSYHVSTNRNAGAFFFGDDKHVIVTPDASWIERVIDRKDQAENNTLLGYFAKNQHFTMVTANNGTAGQTTLPPGFESPQFQNIQKLAQDISMLRLDVNMPSGVDLKVTLTCKTDSGAQQIHAETTKGIDGLKQQAQQAKLFMPDAAAEIDGVLNSLKVNLSGTNMDVAVSIPSATIDRLKSMLQPPPGGVSPGAAGFPSGASPGALPPGFPAQTTLPPGTAPPPGVVPPGVVPPQN